MKGFFLHKDVINYLHGVPRAQRLGILGTGSYLLPNPAVGVAKRATVHVPNITYDDALARSFGCLEATWVPNHFGTLEQRKAKVLGCGAPCQQSGDCDITTACVFCNPFDGCEA